MQLKQDRPLTEQSLQFLILFLMHFAFADLQYPEKILIKFNPTCLALLQALISPI